MTKEILIERTEMCTLIEWRCDWYYDAVSIQDIRTELDRLESLGATHIEFDYKEYYGDFNYNFKAYQYRPETDEEFELRKQKEIEKAKLEKERQEILERNNYLRLKKKYEG